MIKQHKKAVSLVISKINKIILPFIILPDKEI